MAAWRSATRAPLPAREPARFAATVDFPTPPFPLPTAMMFRTLWSTLVSGAGARRTSDVMFTSTSFTPGTFVSTACFDCSRRRSLTGQAGVVRFTSKETVVPSILRLRMKLRLTMSRFRSGSITARSASNTVSSRIAASLTRSPYGKSPKVGRAEDHINPRGRAQPLFGPRPSSILGCGVRSKRCVPKPRFHRCASRFRIAAGLTALVMLLAIGEILPGAPAWPISMRLRAILELLLATPICAWAAWPFYVRAVASVRNRSLNMFTLIGLGVFTAYSYSAVAALFPGLFPAAFRGESGEVGVYFEAAAAIVTFVLLGQVLELRARGRTSAALRKLLGLEAKTARRLATGGREQDGPLEQVQAGDLLRA